MTTAVIAHIHDQCGAIILYQETAVELSKSLRSHIRYVHVAYPSICVLVHTLSLAIHPFTVARCPLGFECLDRHGAN